uniref:Ig-like domain-containing protein n=1 Tax=Dicentrarchus labrax TaxID=13489 RepID=A0A8P4GIB7_DICLA
MLLFLYGVLCDEYKVEYQQGHICAVKGSTVVIPCSFHYPGNQIVDRVMWGHERHNIYDGPFIYESISNNTLPRFHYNGDKKHNCSLEISHVEPNDTGKYTFRFITDSAVGKWTGVEGSTLKVGDLNISMTKPNGNRTMNEGESVNLTCINSCDDLSSAFTWFKSGEPFSEGPVLYLSNMSSTNSGNYTCSLKSHTGTTSGVINIDVECKYWTQHHHFTEREFNWYDLIKTFRKFHSNEQNNQFLCQLTTPVFFQMVRRTRQCLSDHRLRKTPAATSP